MKLKKRLLTSRNHIFFGVFIVPQLGSNPKLTSGNPPDHGPTESLADLLLILVDGGAVNVAIPNPNRSLYCCGDPCGAYVIRTERSGPIAGILSPV